VAGDRGDQQRLVQLGQQLAGGGEQGDHMRRRDQVFDVQRPDAAAAQGGQQSRQDQPAVLERVVRNRQGPVPRGRPRRDLPAAAAG
jgi:hypothetical protein